jgi:hypothetical protein
MVDQKASRKCLTAKVPPGSMKHSQVDVLDVSALVPNPQENQRTTAEANINKIPEQ